MFRVNLHHRGDRAECGQRTRHILDQTRVFNQKILWEDLTPWQLSEVLEHQRRHESENDKLEWHIFDHLQPKKRTLREGWDSLTLEERQRRLQLLWSPEEYEAIRVVEQHLRELCDGDNTKISEVRHMMGSLKDVDMRIITVKKNGEEMFYWSALHEAAENAHVEVLAMLLEKNTKEDNCGTESFDVDFRDKHNCTALHLASNKGHKRVVELLISNNCDVNLTGSYNCTALHDASEKNHVEVVKLLIKNNCDIDLKDKDGSSALHLASEKGHVKVVELLVENHCDVNLRDNYNSTALHLASIRGRAELVDILLRHNGLVDAEDFLGRTALYRCAKSGDKKNIKEKLIKAGATFQIKDLRTALTLNDKIVIDTLLHLGTFDLKEFIGCIIEGSANQELRNNTLKALLRQRSTTEKQRSNTEKELISLVQQFDSTEFIFATACKNNIHEFVRCFTSFSTSSINFNIGLPTPIWHAANGGHAEVFKLLLKQKDKINYKKQAPDGTAPLVMAIVKGHLHLLPHFLTLYGDPIDILLECVKFGKTEMIQKSGFFCDMRKNRIVPSHLNELLNNAILSGSTESFDFYSKIAEEHSIAIDLSTYASAINKRLSLALRKKTKLSTKLLHDSKFIRMSKKYPVFNNKIEYNWRENWKPSKDNSFRVFVLMDHIRSKIINKPCNYPEDSKQNDVEQIASLITCLGTPCQQPDECKMAHDLIHFCVQLEGQMKYGKHQGSKCMQYIKPQLSLIGSVAEGTRIGKVTEVDVTITFLGLNETPFRVGKKATELLLPENQASRKYLQGFSKAGEIFDYPKFLQFLLRTIATCLGKIDIDEFGLEIAKEGKYQPCQLCVDDSKKKSASVYMPRMHCEKCVPAVTHTKLGPCLAFRRKGTDIFVTVDLIPVYPIEKEKTLELFTLVNKTLVQETPPFWLDYFNSLMERDVILPENQNKVKGAGKINYVAIKILHYGPDDNYIIRPGQVMKIEHFHKNEMLKNVYIRMKALKDLLQIPAKSYFMKQVVLLPGFMARVQQRSSAAGPKANHKLVMAQLLFDALSRQELKTLFEKRIDFDMWKVELDLKDDNTIPLFPPTIERSPPAIEFSPPAIEYDDKVTIPAPQKEINWGMCIWVCFKMVLTILLPSLIFMTLYNLVI